MSAHEQAEASGQDPRVSAPDAVSHLERFTGRGTGTYAEWRAARWLARQLAGRRRQVVIEPFWCRPHWALAQAWHVALAIAGSLVSVASPRAGGAMLLAALVFVILDATTRASPGRWLTPERASQNVVGLVHPQVDPEDAARLRVIITANYDAGRSALVYRDALRSASSRLRAAMRGMTPGWQGWVVVAIAWIIVTAILRLQGHDSTVTGLIQLPPTIALVVALGLLIELAAAEWSPSAGDNGSGVAVALALGRALAVSPPRHLDVEVVLAGAGEAGGLGLRHFLRRRRHTHPPQNTVVLGIAACTAGDPRWWRGDGSLVPLRFGRRLVALAEQVAAEHGGLDARGHIGRGNSPALPARQAQIPAITIGCLDGRDLAPHSHQPSDVAAAVERRSHDRAVQLGLMLVDAIDAALDGQRAGAG